MNIHVGHIPEQYHKRVTAKAEENMWTSLDEIAVAYEGLNTGLLVENDSFEKHITKFGLYPEAIWDILNQHPGFGMTFDIGHAHHSGTRLNGSLNVWGVRLRLCICMTTMVCMMSILHLAGVLLILRVSSVSLKVAERMCLR